LDGWASNSDLVTTFEQPRVSVRRARAIALTGLRTALDEKLNSSKQNMLVVDGSIKVDPWMTSNSTTHAFVRPAKRMKKYLRSRARLSTNVDDGIVNSVVEKSLYK
jgi:hypothetical protein